MQKHRDVLQQASRLAVAVALCIAAMLAVYALTGQTAADSYNGMVILVIIYILLFRAELCDPLAAILPLLFAQICIKLIDFFRPDPQAAQKTKDGDSTP